MITRFIYPFSLRERMSFLIQRLFYKNSSLNDKKVLLEFNRTIRLDLKNTDVGHKSIILNGFYELQLSRKIVELAKNGGLFADVGANYGYFSCLWAAGKKNNRVIAFEANPDNIPPLINNVNANNFKSEVLISPIALGKETGKQKFYLGSESGQTGWGGLMPNGPDGSIEVPVDTIDNYFRSMNINEIDVLKIDTEGADTWVLYGAANLLRNKKIKHIFYESNVSRMQTLKIAGDEAYNFLTAFGYTIEKFEENEFYAHL